MRKLPELQLKDIQTWANEVAAKAQSAMSEVRVYVCVCVATSARACRWVGDSQPTRCHRWSRKTSRNGTGACTAPMVSVPSQPGNWLLRL